MAGINRPMSRTRKIETKEALFRARKRILKHLVLGFLRQEGLLRAADALVQEAALSPEYQLCDNIDLDIILQDYCSYYLMRFNKQPQFLRQVQPAEEKPARRPQTRKARPERRAGTLEECEERDAYDLPSTFTVTQLVKEDRFHDPETAASAIEAKPLSGFVSHLTPEMRQLAEIVYQDIIRPSDVSWDDVKGLASAKSLLMESIVYPVRHPEVFTGVLSPWRGVLLHGPPGAGKTLLARAAAGLARGALLNAPCSTLVNKWRGDSEKIVKVLFDMAAYYAPSIIFMDEADTLVARAGAGEHEASRRLRAQLLTELDGVAARDGPVLLLANSNAPWDIDPAMLRRLEKRIYIPLPDLKTRTELFEKFLISDTVELCPKVDFLELAARTEGYSGSEIKLVCKEALMTAVRKMLPDMAGKGWSDRRDRVSLADIVTAIEKTKPVSKNLARRHEQWQNEMGCS